MLKTQSSNPGSRKARLPSNKASLKEGFSSFPEKALKTIRERRVGIAMMAAVAALATFAVGQQRGWFNNEPEGTLQRTYRLNVEEGSLRSAGGPPSLEDQYTEDLENKIEELRGLEQDLDATLDLEDVREIVGKMAKVSLPPVARKYFRRRKDASNAINYH